MYVASTPHLGCLNIGRDIVQADSEVLISFFACSPWKPVVMKRGMIVAVLKFRRPQRGLGVARFAPAVSIIAAMGAFAFWWSASAGKVEQAKEASKFSCPTPHHHDGDAIRCGGKGRSMPLYGIDAP